MTTIRLALSDRQGVYQVFFSGRCDALSQDSSAVAVALATVAPNAADYVVLPNASARSLSAPSRAKATSRRRPARPPRKRLLGVGDDMGKPFDLDPNWPGAVIRAVGYYGERYDRSLGRGSQMKLPRGLNDLWNKGGLMYAVPFR